MVPVALALGASLAWGASDFLAGLKTRRLALLWVLLVSQATGLVLVGIAALASGTPLPGGHSALLAAGAGVAELIGRLELTDFIANPSIDITVGVGATIFLVIAGALAGYFPARAAAKVNPIHALRDQ